MAKYELGDTVKINGEDYKIVPPRNLNNACDGCSFRVNEAPPKGHCEASEKIPCIRPSRIYVKVTPEYRVREKNKFKNFIKYIIKN